MPAYIIFNQEEKINHEKLLFLFERMFFRRAVLRFSPGIAELDEKFHRETPYEILIPSEKPLIARICTIGCSIHGSIHDHCQTLPSKDFLTVEVGEGQDLIVFPQICCKIAQYGLFLAYKPAINNSASQCPYQDPHNIDQCNIKDFCLFYDIEDISMGKLPYEIKFGRGYRYVNFRRIEH